MKTWRLRRSEKDVIHQREQPLSDEVLQRVADVAVFVPEETDWLRVKKLLMLELSPGDRQLFSRRDDRSRKHHPFNVFERNIRDAWRRITGNDLMMPTEKQMDDVDPKSYL